MLAWLSHDLASPAARGWRRHGIRASASPRSIRATLAARDRQRSFRNDWLFSYQPTPGTVLFAGYGNTLADLDERQQALRRTQDGFFFKVSYLFRISRAAHRAIAEGAVSITNDECQMPRP